MSMFLSSSLMIPVMYSTTESIQRNILNLLFNKFRNRLRKGEKTIYSKHFVHRESFLLMHEAIILFPMRSLDNCFNRLNLYLHVSFYSPVHFLNVINGFGNLTRNMNSFVTNFQHLSSSYVTGWLEKSLKRPAKFP